MMELRKDGGRLQATLPATFEAVEELAAEIRRQSAASLSAADCFIAELMAREALNNALIHGCRGDPKRCIRCQFQVQDRTLTISVDDDGEGFDWRAAWDGECRVSNVSGRGIRILRRYANSVSFNDRGNAVTIVKKYS